MFIGICDFFKEWLIRAGMDHSNATYISGATDFLLVLLLSAALYYLAKFVIIKVIKRFAAKTKSIWDDVLLEKKVFNRMAFLIPGILIYQTAPSTLAEFSNGTLAFVLKSTNIYITLIFLLIINSFFNAVYEVYQRSDYAIYHPVKGYIQVGKIVMFIVGTLFILSFLFNQSPIYMLGGLGAFSAVLLLVFKDPILGFVGGIQLSANDMVRQGDWINMPKFGADGIVQEISLTTVKVLNFDNTITTLPTYALVSESFQNFRGMKESGVRRIKRSISIDISSVKFCTEEMLERFRMISLIKDYIDSTQAELEKYNKENTIDNSVPVNGRRQTNIGIFRAYLENFLTNHPFVHNDSDQLVRQLQSTSSGIPIEIYAFINETEFIRFEKVQSDIFDHILAIVPEFELRVFQSPTGEDLRKSNTAYWENGNNQ